MRKIKKFLIDIFIIFGLSFSVFSLAGCSMYNHNRIKSDMLEHRIRITANREYIDLLDAGMEPEDVVKFGTLQDETGRPIGVRAAIDLANIKGLKSYFTTFKEEPIPSTISILVDAAVAYYTAEGVKNLKEDHENSKNNNPANVVNVINFDNISSQGNVNIIQVNNFGDVNKPTN